MLRDLKNENSLTDKSAVFLLFHGCYVRLLCMASVLRSMPDPDYLHYMPLLFVFFMILNILLFSYQLPSLSLSIQLLLIYWFQSLPLFSYKDFYCSFGKLQNCMLPIAHSFTFSFSATLPDITASSFFSISTSQHPC